MDSTEITQTSPDLVGMEEWLESGLKAVKRTLDNGQTIGTAKAWPDAASGENATHWRTWRMLEVTDQHRADEMFAQSAKSVDLESGPSGRVREYLSSAPMSAAEEEETATASSADPFTKQDRHRRREMDRLDDDLYESGLEHADRTGPMVRLTDQIRSAASKVKTRKGHRRRDQGTSAGVFTPAGNGNAWQLSMRSTQYREE